MSPKFLSEGDRAFWNTWMERCENICFLSRPRFLLFHASLQRSKVWTDRERDTLLLQIMVGYTATVQGHWFGILHKITGILDLIKTKKKYRHFCSHKKKTFIALILWEKKRHISPFTENGTEIEIGMNCFFSKILLIIHVSENFLVPDGIQNFEKRLLVLILKGNKLISSPDNLSTLMYKN